MREHERQHYLADLLYVLSFAKLVHACVLHNFAQFLYYAKQKLENEEACWGNRREEHDSQKAYKECRYIYVHAYLLHEPLYSIYTYLCFNVRRSISVQIKTVLHRIPLNVAFTKAHIFQMYTVNSPVFAQCHVTEDIEHLLCYFQKCQAAHNCLVESRGLTVFQMC